MTQVLLIIYCLLIVAGSLLGGMLPSRIQLTHRRMQLIVSLVGGLMLGIGIFHLLPHGVAEMGSLDRAAWWMMLGMLVMFFLLRTFHFHQHGVAEVPPGEHDHDSPHDHDHDHSHAHPHGHGHAHAHRLSWAGVAVGLALHTLIDGLALGASVQADAAHGDGSFHLFGLGTFLAIALHKPLDAVSITTLMAVAGWSTGWRQLVNFGFAIMCPLGAVLFMFGVDQLPDHQHVVVGCALAFSAGVFVCISLGDLLPELEFHSHDRTLLSILLVTGVALAYGIGFLEPEHAHRHTPEATEESRDDHSDHEGHEHLEPDR